jgi:hypothetical protein
MDISTRAQHILSILVLIAATAFGQSGTSSITGTVTDASGAAIPNVELVLTNGDNGSRLQAVTNASGSYRYNALLPGTYKLEAQAKGFEKLTQTGIILAVSQSLPVDLTLQVGETSTAVTVEAEVSLLETQSTSTGQFINRRMVATLPMPNRAATSLVALAPGVVMINSGEGAENYPVFSVAGGRARNQDFTLDGGNVTNAVGLTRPQQMTSLPMDAMQEFRVISNNYAAEYGHSTGGIITLSTRSGTNQFHGSVFEFLRNSALDARNFFAAQRPPLNLNQYGGSLGGPIVHDKLHFFVSWEETRQGSSVIALQTVPTAAERTGDFSGRALIFDPATTVGRDRQPFPNNTIPADRFDSVASNTLAYFPLANRTGTSKGANNYAANADSSLRRDIGVAKVDYQIRSNDQLSVRYYINDSFIQNNGSFPQAVAAPDANTNYARIQSAMAAYTHIFNPSVVNSFSTSFLQRTFLDDRFGEGENLAGSLGLTGVSGAGFPLFVTPGYVTLGGPTNIFRHQTPIRDLQFLDSLSYLKGKHSLKFGVEYRAGANTEQRDRSSSGSFSMSALITGKPGVSGTGDAFASLLLGQVNSAGIAVSDVIPSRASYWAGYAQDDWRISESFTLNYGLRWEAEIPRYVVGNLQNSFDPSTLNPISGTPGVVTYSGVNGVPRRAFNTDLNNFGPRLGFAWKLPGTGGTVLRAGGGFFFGPTVSNTIGDAATLGFSTSSTLVVSQADFNSAMILSNGYPPYTRPALTPGLGAVPVGQSPNTAVTYFERDRPTPISYQYNVNLQREVKGGTVIEGGLLANVSHHLTANDLTLSQVAPNLMGPGNSQIRRPYPQYSNVSSINPAIGNSTYYAGFIRAEKRFSHGFSVLAHYTYSKFIDDVASSNEYGDAGSYMDAYNRGLDKGLSGTDVPNRIIASGLYEMPSLKSSRLLNAIAGGWQIGGYLTVQSGANFTVVTASNTTNAFSAGPLRPNIVGDIHAGEQSLNRWFNTAAFRAPAQFTFGNSPRSVLRGDSLQTLDFTLSKTFTVTERFRVDLRGEFYNALNHPNFDLPGHTLGAADFGTVLSAKAARTTQLGLRFAF